MLAVVLLEELVQLHGLLRLHSWRCKQALMPVVLAEVTDHLRILRASQQARLRICDQHG